MWEETSRLQSGQQRLAGRFLFSFKKEVSPRFAGMNICRVIVLSLIQFDSSYSLAIITLNPSTFILGSSASKSIP